MQTNAPHEASRASAARSLEWSLNLDACETMLFGPKQSFRSKAGAERFIRHLTRELTAGGVAHWVELRQDGPTTWTPIVHLEACRGGRRCTCGSDAD